MSTTVRQEGNDIVVGVRADLGQVKGEFRELEYISYRLVSILGRMGLPKDVDALLSKLQHLILTFRMLHSAMMYLQTGTVFGLAMGTLTMMGSVFSFASAGGPAPQDIGVELGSRGD